MSAGDDRCKKNDAENTTLGHVTETAGGGIIIAHKLLISSTAEGTNLFLC